MTQYEEALAAALRFLSPKERFEGEVRRKLEGHDAKAVDAVMEHLKSKNIVNDERAVQSYIKGHSGRKAVGAFKMIHELRSHGVSEELIAAVCPDGSDTAAAQSALQGKFRNDPALKPKAFRFLLSRGFGYDSANQAIRNYFEIGV